MLPETLYSMLSKRDRWKNRAKCGQWPFSRGSRRKLIYFAPDTLHIFTKLIHFNPKNHQEISKSCVFAQISNSSLCLTLSFSLFSGEVLSLLYLPPIIIKAGCRQNVILKLSRDRGKTFEGVGSPSKEEERLKCL